MDKFLSAAVKRTFATTYPLRTKLAKKIEEVEKLKSEIKELTDGINDWEANIMRRTGYTTDQLVKRTTINSGKKDKNGKDIFISKDEFIYPNIIPTPEEIGQQNQLPNPPEVVEIPVEATGVADIANLG